MIDKKLYYAINENNKKEHAKYIKSQKRKEKINLITCIMLVLAILTLVLVFGNVIHQETQKGLKKCLKSGHSQNYCLRSL